MRALLSWADAPCETKLNAACSPRLWVSDRFEVSLGFKMKSNPPFGSWQSLKCWRNTKVLCVWIVFGKGPIPNKKHVLVTLSLLVENCISVSIQNVYNVLFFLGYVNKEIFHFIIFQTIWECCFWMFSEHSETSNIKKCYTKTKKRNRKKKSPTMYK